jgi:3-isopropylmalate/(R)-2-methylmalate dehydratase large subunit
VGIDRKSNCGRSADGLAVDFPGGFGDGMSRSGSSAAPRTLVEKIWNRHVVAEDGGELLLHVDRAFIHEGASHAFDKLQEEGRTIARPKQVFAFTDHYVPTAGRDKGVDGIGNAEIRNMVIQLQANAARHGITLFGIDDPRQGILHIVPPEQGITQPGLLICGADSHTATHGAFGCLAFGIGASEMMHVMATQAIWQRPQKSMRIAIDGELGFGIAPKDIILAVIASIGVDGGTGHIVEYAGGAIRKMSMEGRMTICNMSIEAGARAGMVAPDETTFAYLHGRPHAPIGEQWEAAMALWKTLPSDPGARFEREVALNAADIAPMVTWGTNPAQGAPVTGAVPNPRDIADAIVAQEVASAIEYQGLTPGMALCDIRVDKVFIGSCTNSRIEDLRAAAEVAKLGKAVVTAWVVPGSQLVKRQAEQEGLDAVFRKAGFEWREPGCSLCTAINGDQLRPGERCASTSNRNFKGRQGTGGRTHLVSPAMAAAAALEGRLTDVRELLKKA